MVITGIIEGGVFCQDMGILEITDVSDSITVDYDIVLRKLIILTSGDVSKYMVLGMLHLIIFTIRKSEYSILWTFIQSLHIM